MFEVASNARTAAAFQAAREERSRAFVGFFKWVFGVKSVPLPQMGLTEPSRCV